MTEATTLSAHFDSLFAGDADPWGCRTRWYEQRKRAVTLASLPRSRFRRAYEPGCAAGELTSELAQRCDAVIATDASAAAVERARERLRDSRNVVVSRASTPADWPGGTFDLIVVSELGYYLDDQALSTLVDRCTAALSSEGVLVACHWRRPEPDLLRTGDAVNEAIGRRCGMSLLAHHLEKDFVLDVWSRDSASVAAKEGLA